MLLTVALAGCCGLESRFYQPEARVFPVPEEVQEAFVDNEDGLSIQTWFLPAPSVREGRRENAAALLFCPGSRRQIDTLLPILQPIAEQADLGLMLVSYRGYGRSEPGRCLTRRRTLCDVEAAHRLLRERPDVDADRIAVMGYSLGGVPALGLAAQEPSIPVVVVGGTYATADEALDDAGLGAWSWLISDSLDPADSARQLSARAALVFHGERDRDVPPYHAHLLSAELSRAGAELQLCLLPDANHYDVLVPESGMREVLVEFLRRTLQPAADPR